MLKRYTYYLSHIMRPEVHAILIEEVPVQTTFRDGASFVKLTSLIGLKYYHQPSNFELKISILTSYVQAEISHCITLLSEPKMYHCNI